MGIATVRRPGSQPDFCSTAAANGSGHPHPYPLSAVNHLKNMNAFLLIPAFLALVVAFVIKPDLRMAEYVRYNVCIGLMFMGALCIFSYICIWAWGTRQKKKGSQEASGRPTTHKWDQSEATDKDKPISTLKTEGFPDQDTKKTNKLRAPSYLQARKKDNPSGQVKVRVDTLTSEEVDAMSKGANFVNRGSDRFKDKYVVFKAISGPLTELVPSNPNGVVKPVVGQECLDDEINQHLEPMLKVCRNVCRHHQGTFVKCKASDLSGGVVEDIEDMVNVIKCTNHGWMIDCKSMRYVEPAGTNMIQEECMVICEENGNWGIYELLPRQPWEQERMPREELREGEVTVTYLSHACVEFKLGDKTLVKDPWLLGPAFMRGWWLYHKPPEVKKTSTSHNSLNIT